MMSEDSNRKEGVTEVRDFWGTEACGTHFVQSATSDAQFFDEYRRFRYETEWHIPLLVPFSEVRDKRVLEIGCGNGADGTMFAINGAEYVGVDLTETAVVATRKHFDAVGVHGTFRVENAEALSFADHSFDVVYSYGVLHHTSDPRRAIHEVFRVLKPGGRAIVMLYNKNSFNYYIRVMGYMRLRLLLKIVSRLGRFDRDRRSRGDLELEGLRGNDRPGVWQLHYENFLREGWSYLRPNRFIHHATDGPECPFAFAFTKSDIGGLFSEFSGVSIEIAHFPLRKYFLGKLVPISVEKWLPSQIGWYSMIFARK